CEEFPCPVVTGVHSSGSCIQKIWSSKITHEHKVPTQHKTRFCGLSTIGDEERHVFGRVPRSVDRFERDVAQGDAMAMFHPDSVVETLTINPIWATFIRYIDFRSSSVGQFEGS